MSAIPALKRLGLEDCWSLNVSMGLQCRPLIPVLERSKGRQGSFDLRLASLVYIVSPGQPKSLSETLYQATTKQTKLLTHCSRGLELKQRTQCSTALSSTLWVLQCEDIRAVTEELAESSKRAAGLCKVSALKARWTRVSWGCRCSSHSKGWMLLFIIHPKLSVLPFTSPSVWSQRLCNSINSKRDTVFGLCAWNSSPLRNLWFYSPRRIYCRSGHWPWH